MAHPSGLLYPTLLKLLTIQSTTDKHFAVIDLTNTFCSVTISTASRLQIAFTSKREEHNLTQLLMGHLNSLNIIHKLCRQELNSIQFFLGSQVRHYIDEIHWKYSFGTYNYSQRNSEKEMSHRPTHNTKPHCFSSFLKSTQ